MREKYLKIRDKYFENFECRNYKFGIETIKIGSCKEFIKIIEKFVEYKKYYIWRGQEKDWKLISKFDRDYIKKKFGYGKRDDTLNKIREKFIEHLKGLNPQPHKIDFSKEVNIWSIGQHYGLSTPLIDWTENPYIALYFAFCKKSKKEKCDKVVYAMNIGLKLDLRIFKIKVNKVPISRERKRLVDLIDLSDDKILKKDRRIKAQEAMFTEALDGKKIEKYVKNFSKNRPKDIIKEKKIMLIKILINDNDKSNYDFLNYLKNKKKITRGKLFPDYAGAVEVCNIDLKNLSSSGKDIFIKELSI